MTELNETDTIGCYVKVKLTNDEEMEGNVFTYNPGQQLLVLMQHCEEDEPTFRAIRTPFIKEFSVEHSDPEQHYLPEQLDFQVKLPSMCAGNGKNLFKYSSSQLRDAREKRKQQLKNVQPEAPIAAVDAHTKITRVFPTATWDADESVIKASKDVVILGDPDWNSPKATLVGGVSTPQTEAECKRFQKVLDRK